MKFTKLSLLLITVGFYTQAQQLFLPLDHDENAFSEMYLSKKDVNFHTSIKPYFYEEVQAVVDLDSIEALLTDTNRLMLLPTSNWAKALRWSENKLMDEDFIYIDKPGFKLRANLLFDVKGRRFGFKAYHAYSFARNMFIRATRVKF